MQMAWRTCPRCTGQKARDELAGRDMADATVILGASPVKAARAAAPPPEWVARIDATQGPASGKTFELKPGRWKFGRQPRPEAGFELVAIAEPGMSRDHFVIEAGKAAVVLRDLGSTNGTFVAGQRVERHVLRDGDVIQTGGTALRVTLPPQGA
jgi:S-DNA-T family DNA segregation ATPase FtsK/SpoIIIE